MADTKRFSQDWTVTDIVDTRDYELVGDRWKPVPGSGDAEPCACCGKALVIHVHVQRDKERAILGQACATKASSKLAAGIKSVGVRRADPLVDDLIGAGLKLHEAVRTAHNARVFIQSGNPLWGAVHGHIQRAQMEKIWNNWPQGRELHRRIVVVLKKHGITDDSL